MSPVGIAVRTVSGEGTGHALRFVTVEVGDVGRAEEGLVSTLYRPACHAKQPRAAAGNLVLKCQTRPVDSCQPG